MSGQKKCPKAERMAEIRKDRREEDFSEVSLWLPNEKVSDFRDLAWSAIDDCGRDFPHRAPEGQRTRERKIK